jgi:hypothetical protein
MLDSARLHLSSGVNSFLSDWKLISLLNALFFCLAFGIPVFAGFFLPPAIYGGQELFVPPEPVAGNVLFTVLFIFAFNLVLSAFIVVTLPGFFFFPLSVLTLGLRAVLWGLLLFQFPLGYFLAALPTVVLEGEAYVIAARALSVLVQGEDNQLYPANESGPNPDVFVYDPNKNLQAYLVFQFSNLQLPKNTTYQLVLAINQTGWWYIKATTSAWYSLYALEIIQAND